MTKTAESIPITVHKTRSSRRQQMCKSMLIGIGLRLITVIFELVGYSYFHSAALMADVFSSLIDIICSSCLILCIYLADKPPDSISQGSYRATTFLCLEYFFECNHCA